MTAAIPRLGAVRWWLVVAGVALVLAWLRTPGSLGLDAQLRLASARWMWAGTSPDTVTDIPPGQLDLFLLEGRDDRPQVWFGAGQQLLLVPADVALHMAAPEAPRAIQRLAMALVYFPLVLVAAACALFLLLRILGMSARVGAGAVVAVLLGSPLARYVTEGFETGEEVACLALALAALVAHRRRPSWWSAFGLVVAPALMVLLRLPHVAVYGALVLWLVLVEIAQGRRPNRATGWRLALLGLSLAVGIALDRTFQWWRFGDWTSTYSHAAEVRWGEFWGEPVEFFGGSLTAGVWHQLAGPGKALFLYHPLTLLVPVFVAWWGCRTPADVVEGQARAIERGAVWVVAGVLAGVYLLFYARYYFTFDTQSWGNRYLEAPLVVMLAVMLGSWGERWRALTGALRVYVVAVAIVAAGVMLVGGASTFRDELALDSRAFPARDNHGVPPLDATRLYGDFSFGRRALIAARFVAGEEATPGDDTPFAPAYLPFQVAARVAPTPGRAWFGKLAIGGWTAAWVGLMVMVLCSMLARPSGDRPEPHHESS